MRPVPDAAGRTAPRVSSVVPGIASLSTYQPGWLRHDLVAGLVLTALLVPQGMAYAELAGLPPITVPQITLPPLLGL